MSEKALTDDKPEQKPVYIKDVALVDFRNFKGEHRFSFTDEKGDWCRWTVFLGNNNSGKTNLLKAIASLEPEEKSDNKTGKSSYLPTGYNRKIIQDKDSTYGINIYPYLDDFFESIPELYNRLKVNLGYQFYSSIGGESSLYANLKIYGYGVIRNIEKTGISSENQTVTNSDNLFFNSNLINFEDWLLQLDYAANNKNSKAEQRRNILKELLTSSIFPEIKGIKFVSDEKLNNYVNFETENGWHRMSELGFGYQSTLSWLADFCKKLFDRYPESPNPLNEPAVLLIDEIDLHLHPQWQRGLIKSLSELLPQTQFIVTTHSPFIIQSMENVNLYTLNHVGDHTEVTHLGNKSYKGWTIEEILNEIMGMDGKMHTDYYSKWMKAFDTALDKSDYFQAKEAYEALMKILHPQSVERKLLDIQFSQLVPDGND